MRGQTASRAAGARGILSCAVGTRAETDVAVLVDGTYAFAVLAQGAGRQMSLWSRESAEPPRLQVVTQVCPGDRWARPAQGQ